MKTLLSTMIILISLCTSSPAAQLNLGAIFELKGSNNATAQEAMNGALLAVKKINKTKPQAPVKLTLESTDGNPLTIIKAVNKLTSQEKFSAVTGIINTDTALTAAPAFQTANIPYLSTGAQADGMADSIGSNIFTLAVPDIRTGQIIAEFTTNTLQTENIVLISSNLNDSTARQADSFARRFKQNNGKIMAEMRITENDPDFSFIVNKIKELAPKITDNSTVVNEEMGAADFDDTGAVIVTQKRDTPPAQPEVEAIVIFAPPAASAKLLTLFKEKDITYQIIAGTSFDTVSMRQPLNEWPETVYYASQASLSRENKLVESFIEAYTELFGQKPVTGYAALGFDSIMLLAAAGEKETSTTIGKGLQSITDFEGVSGKISFRGRSAQKPLYIIESKSGQNSLAAELE